MALWELQHKVRSIPPVTVLQGKREEKKHKHQVRKKERKKGRERSEKEMIHCQTESKSRKRNWGRKKEETKRYKGAMARSRQKDGTDKEDRANQRVRKTG